ncbi:MAG: hypothetical protein MMC33_008211 [Icmadophila ericetorum]|nr:hypothetical protein [Icmadophila ericetorum]
MLTCSSNYQCQFGPGLAFWQSSHPCGSSFNTLTPTNIVAGSVTGDETIQTTFTSQGGANAGGFNAYSVQVRWQSTDIDILKLLNPNFTPSTTTVSSSSSSLSTTPTLLITTIIVPPTSSSSPTPVPMTGLSTGAKVAIGVGVGIVAFLLLTSLLVIIRRRRHSYKPAATQPPDSLQPHQTYQSLEPKDAISMKPIRHIAEPPSEQGRHELAVSHNSLQSRAELPINDGFRVELPINDESGAVSGRSNPIQFNRLAR